MKDCDLVHKDNYPDIECVIHLDDEPLIQIYQLETEIDGVKMTFTQPYKILYKQKQEK